ncbi:hypothetical protein GCM10010447_08320 [Streptomyces fulvorobeus]
MEDHGAPALEECAELLGATGGGHPYREAREGPVLCVVVHGVYPALVSRCCSAVRSSETANTA